MARIALELRKTHKYVGAYQNLDEWETLGSAEITSRIVRPADEDDYCEPYKHVWYLKVQLDEPQDTPEYENSVKQALRDSFTHAGCAHDYDCCGCRSTYVRRVIHLGDSDRFIVIGASSRNY